MNDIVMLYKTVLTNINILPVRRKCPNIDRVESQTAICKDGLKKFHSSNCYCLKIFMGCSYCWHGLRKRFPSFVCIKSNTEVLRVINSHCQVIS